MPSNISYVEQKENRHLHTYQKLVKKYDGNFITVDPGGRKNGGTGISFFSGGELTETSLWCSEEREYYSRSSQICRMFEFDLSKQRVAYPIFIEEPTFFDSHKGHTAARSDALFKLTMHYGRLYQIAQEHFTTIPLKINHWKGQMTDKMVGTRVKRIFRHTFQVYIQSAVGMGLYLTGKL
mgnify:CR=1 FL=1